MAKIKKVVNFSDYAFINTLLDQKVDPSLLLALVGLQMLHDPDSYFSSHQMDSKQFFEMAFDTKLRETQLQKVNQTRNDLRSVFQSYKSKEIYKAFMSFMWFAKMPCSDIVGLTSEERSEKSIIKSCKWKGKAISCSSIFKKVTTDNGICCAFNRDSADKIYTESVYTNTVETLEKFEKINSFEDSALPDWYINNVEPNSEAGNQMGLSLILDAHTDQIADYSLTSDVEGLTAMVIPPDEFPVLAFNGFQVKAGHNNLVALSATRIKADNDIRSIDPQKRNCFFSDETNAVKLYKKYSQTNCILECKLLYAQKHIKNENMNYSSCTPWNLPFVGNASKMCDPWEKVSIFSIIAKSVPSSACSHCLPDCNQVIYQTLISTNKFRGCDELNVGMTDFCKLFSLGNIQKIIPVVLLQKNTEIIFHEWSKQGKHTEVKGI
jgi:Amiloride-sensitive sodium channel